MVQVVPVHTETEVMALKVEMVEMVVKVNQAMPVHLGQFVL